MSGKGLRSIERSLHTRTSKGSHYSGRGERVGSSSDLEGRRACLGVMPLLPSLL
jgi:hypothetical protein